jgi:DNA repair exonuclease SbcCD nuclease subunit
MRQINHEDSIKILHVADLHIGSAMAVSKRVGRNNDLTAVTWLALENVIDLALKKNVASL